MSELIKNAKRIFYESLDCPPAEQEGFVDKACGDNDELRRLTKGLLEANASPASFLDRPVVEHAPPDTHRDVSGGTDGKQFTSDSLATEEGSSLEEQRLRYRVLRLHAQGGLGEVFVAEDREFGREVALKEIRTEFARDGNLKNRFLLEAEVTGRLEHPGIVPVYGVGHHNDGRPYYAMRFIRGETFEEAIAHFHDGEASGQTPDERSRAMRQLLGRFVAVCQATAYAHSRGVIHRDLKPNNVMLGPYGETLIVDWGLARVLATAEAEASIDTEEGLLSTGNAVSATRAGTAMGTPAYMSPEQASGDSKQVGPLSDVYSLGAMLYKLLTGKTPRDEKLPDLLAKAQRGEFPRPRDVNKNVPAALEAVCLKAMAVDPKDRYGGALELAADVDNWLADEPLSGWHEPIRTRASRWIRKHQRFTAVAITLAFVAVIAASVGGLWYQTAEAKRSAQQAQLIRDTSSALDQVEKQLLDLEKGLVEPHASRSLVYDLDEWRRQLEAVRASWQRVELIAEADTETVQATIGKRFGAVKRELEGHERHLKLAQRFDRIRLDAVRVGSDRALHMEAAGVGYQQMFREVLDVEVGKDEPDEIARRIRESSFRQIFVAALDHWAVGTRLRDSQDKLLFPAILEIARKADPDAWRDRFRDLKTWKKNRDWVNALADEVDVTKQPPHTLDALAFRLRPEKRRSILKMALLEYPNDFWLNFAMTRLGETPAERTAYLQAALAIRPDTVVIYNNLGVVLSQQEDVAGAIAAYRKAIAINPKEATISYFNLGTVYLNQGRWQEAVDTFQIGISQDPNQATYRSNLGLALLQLGRYDESVQEFEASLAIDSSHFSAQAGVGEALLSDCRYVESMKAFEKAMQLMSKSHPKYARVERSLQQARGYAALMKEEATRITMQEGRAQVSGELKADGFLEASFPNRGCLRAAYLVHLEANKHYQIDASGDYPTCLRVEDAQQHCLRFNNFLSPTNPRRSRLVFTPEENGHYKVVVSSQLPEQSGPFELMITEVQEVGSPLVQSAESPPRGNFTRQAEFEVDMDLESGQMYSLELSAGPGWRLKSIQAPKRQPVDLPSGLGPRVLGLTRVDLTPATSGKYLVVVGGSGHGPFTLRVRNFGPSVDPTQ